MNIFLKIMLYIKENWNFGLTIYQEKSKLKTNWYNNEFKLNAKFWFDVLFIAFHYQQTVLMQNKRPVENIHNSPSLWTALLFAYIVALRKIGKCDITKVNRCGNGNSYCQNYSNWNCFLIDVFRCFLTISMSSLITYGLIPTHQI